VLQAKIIHLELFSTLGPVDKKPYARTRRDTPAWASHEQRELPDRAGIYSLRCERAHKCELHSVPSVQCLLCPVRLLCWHVCLIRGKAELHGRHQMA